MDWFCLVFTRPTQFRGVCVIYTQTCVNNGILHTLELELFPNQETASFDFNCGSIGIVLRPLQLQVTGGRAVSDNTVELDGGE